MIYAMLEQDELFPHADKPGPSEGTEYGYPTKQLGLIRMNLERAGVSMRLNRKYIFRLNGGAVRKWVFIHVQT